MSWPVSARYRSTIASSDTGVNLTRIDVCQTDGTVIYPDLPYLAGGSVSVDETRQVRRTISITVPSTPAGASDSLVPVAQADNQDSPAVGTAQWGGLLHPSSGYELRAYRGLQYIDETSEMVPLGVFRMSKPSIADQPGTSYQGGQPYTWGQSSAGSAAQTGSGGIVITVSGSDRSAVISRIGYQEPYVVAANTDVAVAIRALLNSRMPGLTYVQMASGYLLPGATFGQDPSTQNDPFADALQLAQSATMELFFDEEGRVVLRPVAVPSTAPILTTFSEDAGDAAFFTSTQNLDETQQFNQVILICDGPGGAPLQASASVSNPNSPIYYGGPWGAVPYVYKTDLLPNPGLTSGQNADQAQQMAASKLQQIVRAFNAPTFSAVPDGSLAPGDRIQLTASRLDIDDGYAVSQMTLPLDVATAMTVTCRPQEAP